jgi:phosphinothricin acetyltransferase
MIRAARTDDFEAIAAITAHYVERTAIHFAYAAPSADELRAQWQADDRHPWLVDDGDDDGDRDRDGDRDGDGDGDERGVDAVLGYAKAGAWRTRDAYRWSAELGIYLAADRRGRGRGRALLAALLDELIARGFHAAIAGITLPNPASVGLFEAAGFAHAGSFREVGWKHDAWHDVGFWQRVLTAGPPPAASAPPR